MLKKIFECYKLLDVLAYLNATLCGATLEGNMDFAWQVHYQVPGDCLVCMMKGFFSVQDDYFKNDNDEK